MQGKLIVFVVAVILILAGCAPRMQEPMWVCPGKESATEALSILRSRSQNTVPMKANGQCLLKYYVEGKPYKENFPVKLWVSPPNRIRLQGDVAFNPKGIVLGSNEDEFWLVMKPKEIRSYFWGQWAEGNCLEKMMISPELVLEALGIVEVSGEEDWSLSNEGVFDVLTKRNEQNGVIKKMYVYSCDYLVRRIEYFDANGQALVIAELGKYKEVSKGFFVPAVIKIVRRTDGDSEDSFKITLGSVKPVNFSEKQKRLIFARPKPRGFKHIYKIIDGEMIEQPQ